MDLLKNENQREQGFKQILNNPELMSELMGRMMHDDLNVK